MLPYRKTNALWEYFTVIEPNKLAKCSICDVHVSHHQTSISNLRRHFKTKHPVRSLEEAHQNSTSPCQKYLSPCQSSPSDTEQEVLDEILMDSFEIPTEEQLKISVMVSRLKYKVDLSVQKSIGM